MNTKTLTSCLDFIDGVILYDLKKADAIAELEYLHVYMTKYKD